MSPFRIKVNTLVVGAIETDMNASVWQDEERWAMVNESIPFGRMGLAEEVASML